MCDRCGLPASGSHAITLSERPAHRLVGSYWEGSHDEVRAGALKVLLARAKTLSERTAGIWRSPLVVLTWNVRACSVRYFVGIAADVGELDSTGFDTIELPEMNFVSSWHGPDDGGVVEHYLHMIEWIEGQGLVRDTGQFAQREEYPNDLDLDRAPTLRLLLPVSGVAAAGGFVAA